MTALFDGKCKSDQRYEFDAIKLEFNHFRNCIALPLTAQHSASD